MDHQKAGAAKRRQSIVGAYCSFLGRLPDHEGLQHYFASGMTIEEIKHSVRNSKEAEGVNTAVANTRERLSHVDANRHLLLFGAYGNGNLGDREMAGILKQFIESEFDASVHTYSLLDVADYHLDDPSYKLRVTDLPFNIRVLALFDGLIAGGGGLLALPHEPIWNPGLRRQIPVPYGFLGVGAANPLPAHLKQFVAGANFATGRDLESVAALSQANKRAAYCPDPILSLGPISAEARSSGEARLFILRGPLNPTHYELVARIGPRDRVVAVEPAVDYSLAELFPALSFVRGLEKLTEFLRPFDTVVSERYHGLIAAMLAGKRVFGIPQAMHNGPKIRALFKELEIDPFQDFLTVDANGSPPYPFDDVRAKIEKNRHVFHAAAKAAIGSILSPATNADQLLDRA